MKGLKTGGREKGTPNRRSLEIAEVLAQNGFDPDAPWLYWARVLKSHLTPPPKQRTDGRSGVDKAEQFFQGRVTLSDGDAGTHQEEVWNRATADMADKAAKGLAPYIRPQLMRIQGTGAGGALLIQFEEDPRKQGTPRSPGEAQAGKPTLRVPLEEASMRRRVKEL